MTELVFLGIAEALTLVNLLAVAAGVSIGIVMGAIPGLSSIMAIAVAVPMTLTLSPLAAIGLLVGVMKGGGFGGAISATLLNTPGEPSAAATALEAYPMAHKKGQPKRALSLALYSSVAGDTASDITLILLAAPLAILASRVGQVELLSILVLSFTLIAGLTGRSFLRGLIAILLGVLCAQVGRVDGGLAERFTFGIDELSNGLPMAAVIIGVLALPEIVKQIAAGQRTVSIRDLGGTSEQDGFATFRDMWSLRANLLRGAALGTGIGVLPGLGSSVAAFLSYGAAKSRSSVPEAFGTGTAEGIAATESANSAVNGANLIPLLTLGIPGSVSAALIVGAFIVHGIDPGPSVFKNDAPLIFGLFACMVLANLMVLMLGQVGLRFFVWVVRAPGEVVFPVVAMTCFAGVYISSSVGLLAVWLMLGFAFFGWLMRRYDFSVVGFVIGFVLGGPFETSLRSAVTILHRDPWGKLLEHPFAIAVFAAVGVFAILRVVSKTTASTRNKIEK